jgi:hypothetical protein
MLRLLEDHVTSVRRLLACRSERGCRRGWNPIASEASARAEMASRREAALATRNSDSEPRRRGPASGDPSGAAKRCSRRCWSSTAVGPRSPAPLSCPFGTGHCFVFQHERGGDRVRRELVLRRERQQEGPLERERGSRGRRGAEPSLGCSNTIVGFRRSPTIFQIALPKRRAPSAHFACPAASFQCGESPSGRSRAG